MGVGLYLGPQRLITALHTPDRSPGDKEPLFRCKTIYGIRPPMLLQVSLKSVISDQQATEVSDIFSQSKLPLYVYALQWLISIILSYQFAGSFLEIFQILFLPPVLQIAIRIIPAALIIKTVGNLVADHCAYAAIIHSSICLVVVKRRLQNPGRENNLVPSRIIVSIDRLRGHKPLILINGFPQLADIVFEPKVGSVPDVFDIRSCFRISIHHQSTVILPFVRKTDLYVESSQLFQSFFLGHIGHPFQLPDPLSHRLDDIINHLLGFFLGFLRKILLGVELTNGFAHGAFRGSQHPLPSWSHLFGTLQLTAVKIKVGFDKVMAQIRSRP